MLASLAEGAGVGTARDCARLSLYCRPSPALTGHPDHRAACHRAQRHQPSHHRDPQPGGAPLPMHATLCVHRAPSRQTLPASLAVHARRWLMRSLQQNSFSILGSFDQRRPVWCQRCAVLGTMLNPPPSQLVAGHAHRRCGPVLQPWQRSHSLCNGPGRVCFR